MDPNAQIIANNVGCHPDSERREEEGSMLRSRLSSVKLEMIMPSSEGAAFSPVIYHRV